MKFSLALLALAATHSVDAEVLSLNESNYAAATVGKTVFIKFFAPWCGHCKAIAPDWEKLAAEWEGHDVGLIAEVDCTAEEATKICEDAGVEGYPSFKWGHPEDLEEYDGDREFKNFSEFAKLKLKPMCSLRNIDLCSDEKKAFIDGLQAKSIEELKADIKTEEDELEKLEQEYHDEVAKLQATYEKLQKVRDDGEHKIKVESGLGLVKAVLKSKEDGSIAEEL